MCRVCAGCWKLRERKPSNPEVGSSRNKRLKKINELKMEAERNRGKEAQEE